VGGGHTNLPSSLPSMLLEARKIKDKSNGVLESMNYIFNLSK
jgi:hypothetical protein